MTAGVYVATHGVLEAHRIGITDAQAGTDRLRVHERHGWRVVGIVHVTTRTEALRVEAATLATLRALGVPQGAAAADMPQGGHTETLPAASLSAAELLRAVRRTAGLDEDGPEGRLGAVVELLEWASRHLGRPAVETAWETSPDNVMTTLARIATQAEDIARAARDGMQASPGARAVRTLERVVQELAKVDRGVEMALAGMSPEERSSEEVRAMLVCMADTAEAIVQLVMDQPLPGGHVLDLNTR
jgi:hypothetical protein